jgi:Tfp pilus assembly protein PilE
MNIVLIINSILSIIKVKLWFATINKYKLYKANTALSAYVKTLSPEKQIFANTQRKMLKTVSSKEAVKLLTAEAEKLSQSLHRVTEKTDNVYRK